MLQVSLFDRGSKCVDQDTMQVYGVVYMQRWVVEDPEGGDASVGCPGELLGDCYVPPVIPRVW